MTLEEWRKAPALVTWARESVDLHRVIDVVKTTLCGVARQDTIIGWREALASLELLKEPWPEASKEIPQTYSESDDLIDS